MLLLRGVTDPRLISAGEGLAELFVEVDVHAFHVPPLSVTLAVILREGTVDQVSPSGSVCEYALIVIVWFEFDWRESV